MFLVGRADIESKDLYDDTPLLCAINARNEPVAIALIDLHADVNAASSEKRPIINAVCVGRTTVLKALLEAGAEVNTQDTDDGCTALSLALGALDDPNMSCDYATLLLDWGADPTMTDSEGRTAAEVVRQRSLRPTAIEFTQDEVSRLLRLFAPYQLFDEA